jgi:hypothetical protein
MDRELIAYLEERFAGLADRFVRQEESFRGEIESLRADIQEIREQGRHTQIQLEAMRDEFRLVAEGVMGVDEKRGNLQVSVENEFREVRALISPAYSGLDHRIHNLEDWRERRERDPLALIRDRFGRRAGFE